MYQGHANETTPMVYADDPGQIILFIIYLFIYSFIYLLTYLFFIYSWQTNIIQCIQLK